MTIYKGSYITNTGGWGGCRSHDVCYAKTEYGAREFTIKTVEDKYKEDLEWQYESKKIANLDRHVHHEHANASAEQRSF